MNNKELQEIEKLKGNNPNAYNTLNQILSQMKNEVSYASHEIKNRLSFMRSSYQLITHQHPEAASFPYWEELGNSINQLINFMERTSEYRYSSNCMLQESNITDILYTLPDMLDEAFPEESRQFYYDIDTKNIIIAGDTKHLELLFMEILKNCYEASKPDDIIEIHSYLNNSQTVLTVLFSNPGTLTVPDTTNVFVHTGDSLCEQLCAPFCTTKKMHTGLGLTIAAEICSKHNADFKLYSEDNIIYTEICFPVITVSQK